MLEIRQLGPKIGVEITGIDVRTIDRETRKTIYQAWLETLWSCAIRT
jgi:taurine dioxygenase